MAQPKWSIVLTKDADADIDDIVIWTSERFGARQAATYHERIAAGLDKLARDPFGPASKARDHDLRRGYRSLHLGGRSRHILLYRIDGRRVVIIRILHDGMDIARHLPPGDE